MKRLILILTLILSPAMAWGDSETIEPEAVGSPDEWDNSGGANKTASVTDDVDGNYILEVTDEQMQRFRNSDPSGIDPEDDIDSVKTFWRAQDNGSGNNRVQIHQYVGANSNDGANIALTASWADYEDNFALAPDGGAWTLSDVNDMFIEAHCTAIGGLRQVQVTKIYHIVYYTPAPEGGDVSYVRRIKEEENK